MADDEKQGFETPEGKTVNAAQEKEAKEAFNKAQADKSEVKLPQINFATFIFSLNSSALVQLGLLEDPSTGQKGKNLPVAKQTIDILGMLQEKTRGNLTAEEEGMLRHILYELRMLYVKEVSPT